MHIHTANLVPRVSHLAAPWSRRGETLAQAGHVSSRIWEMTMRGVVVMVMVMVMVMIMVMVMVMVMVIVMVMVMVMVNLFKFGNVGSGCLISRARGS